MGWLSKLFNLELDSKESSRPYSVAFGRSSGNNSGSKNQNSGGKQSEGSKSDAYNRLKLVLMHDRTQISPDVLSKMRDELVQVISKYVDIDREALELNLETESNTIALVANIPVMRMKTPVTSETTEPATTPSTSTTEPGAAVTTSLEETATAVAASTTQGATKPLATPSQSVSTAPQTTLTQPTLKAPVATASATVKPNPFGETPATIGSSSLHPKCATPVTTPVTTGPTKTPVATP